MKYKKIILVGLFIFLSCLAIFPRITEVVSHNYLFGFDQGRDYLAVKSIVVDKKLTLIGSEIGAGAAGFKGIFHGPFHYYFLAIPFLISDGNPYSGIVLTFLYGMLTITLGYFLGRKIFGAFGGFFVSTLIAISPPLISFSRFVWNSHGAPVFILLAFYCVYKLCQNEKREYRYLFGAGFFSGFIYNFQLAIALPMVITLLLFFVLFLKVKKIKEYLLLFLGIITAFAPMILFEARHNFMALKGILDYIVHPGKTDGSFLVTQYLLGHLGAFFFNFYDTFPRQQVLSGWMIGLLLGVLVFYFLLQEKRRDLKYFSVYLLILPFANFFALSFLRNIVYQYYLINLVLSYILLFSYVWFSSYRKKKYILQVGLTIFLAFLLMQHIPNAVRTFAMDYVDYGGDAKIKGKLEALDYIYADAKGERFCLLVFTPPVYTYAYDYLVWWYGNKRYNYIPCKDKKGIFYLWMEVDSSKPWSWEGWIQTVIKTGKIIETKKLPNGFIIQKRIAEK